MRVMKSSWISSNLFFVVTKRLPIHLSILWERFLFMFEFLIFMNELVFFVQSLEIQSPMINTLDRARIGCKTNVEWNQFIMMDSGLTTEFNIVSSSSI